MTARTHHGDELRIIARGLIKAALFLIAIAAACIFANAIGIAAWAIYALASGP